MKLSSIEQLIAVLKKLGYVPDGEPVFNIVTKGMYPNRDNLCCERCGQKIDTGPNEMLSFFAARIDTVPHEMSSQRMICKDMIKCAFRVKEQRDAQYRSAAEKERAVLAAVDALDPGGLAAPAVSARGPGRVMAQ